MRSNAAAHVFGFVMRAALLLAVFDQALAAMPDCPAWRAEAQMPRNPAQCAALEAVVRKPAALPLDKYETELGKYLRSYCHRNEAAGWRSDKRLRDTGPFTLASKAEVTSGRGFGTHAPVIVWYSPEMLAWLKANRAGDAVSNKEAPPIPDGAMMIKEMFPEPAGACAGRDPSHLLPTSGAAVMVRDNAAAKDGWFWGWFGWTQWNPDWSDVSKNAYPLMGFGQYCVNCHASARDNQTFASLRNVKGEPGRPLVYLTQSLIPKMADLSLHQALSQAPRLPPTRISPRAEGRFLADLGLTVPAPSLGAFPRMPSATFDNVWARPDPHRLNGFVTSDQCLGCHDAGGTGLQFDMTVQGGQGEEKRLYNMSPYATWRSSPMGMAGRDPIFLAQLASETDSFHKPAEAIVQDTCLGCHGILGQRAFKTAQRAEGEVCKPLPRAALDSTPFTTGDPLGDLAEYAGLARDGVSCVACHRMALGPEAAKVHGEPQNSCLDERRALLTPGLTGFAASFTGSFDMGPADIVKGPFDHPREMSMKHALGMQPKEDKAISSSELCGTCHTVHLPILHEGKPIGHVYEQTTYAEWAFSAYRTGSTPDGALPLGAGTQPQSCQGCHMQNHDSNGQKTASKIASIQEYSNFPQTDNNLSPEEIDLPVREGFARHTLVGLNLIFVKMAQQFPALLGLRVEDPMMMAKAVDPIDNTEHNMLRQADGRTATIAVSDVVIVGDALDAKVTVTNKTGHKFPSGVGFRRAFVELTVRDANGAVLWVSGQTNKGGVILDGHGNPLQGELWWKADCSARIEPEARHHQPHHEEITRDDQVQIYEELTASPAAEGAPVCSRGAPARGPLTTSFLSRCTMVKDNRLLPAGYLGLEDRTRIAAALGAKPDLAEEAGPTGVGEDPDYKSGGGDATRYHIPMSALGGRPASVEATLYYQSTPPYYLQDRVCTSASTDTKRLTFIAANLDLDKSRVTNWKLRIATTARASVP